MKHADPSRGVAPDHELFAIGLRVPEQAFATVQGMTRLAETYDSVRIDALCAEALDLNRLVSGFIRERLKNGAQPRQRRPEPDECIPEHADIRGGAYYRNDEGATP